MFDNLVQKGWKFEEKQADILKKSRKTKAAKKSEDVAVISVEIDEPKNNEVEFIKNDKPLQKRNFKRFMTVIDGDLTLIQADSTAIKCYAYNKNTKKLFVQFKPNTDKVYVYENVPQTIFDYMRLSESVGTYWKSLKGLFNCEKIDFNPEWINRFKE